MAPAPPDIKSDNRYSVNETCDLLGISKSKLYRDSNAGKIKYGVRRHNGRRFYRGIDIISYWRA